MCLITLTCLSFFLSVFAYNIFTINNMHELLMTKCVKHIWLLANCFYGHMLVYIQQSHSGTLACTNKHTHPAGCTDPGQLPRSFWILAGVAVGYLSPCRALWVCTVRGWVAAGGWGYCILSLHWWRDCFNIKGRQGKHRTPLSKTVHGNYNPVCSLLFFLRPLWVNSECENASVCLRVTDTERKSSTQHFK